MKNVGKKIVSCFVYMDKYLSNISSAKPGLGIYVEIDEIPGSYEASILSCFGTWRNLLVVELIEE